MIVPAGEKELRSLIVCGRRLSAILITMIAAIVFVACSKKEVKPVSPESKLALEAFQIAEDLRKAYQENDRDALRDLCTSDGYRELIEGMKKFDSVDLAFTPTWVEIANSVVSLSVSWKGVWSVGGRNREERGLGIFVLEGSPLRLARVKRDNPFVQPE